MYRFLRSYMLLFGWMGLLLLISVLVTTYVYASTAATDGKISGRVTNSHNEPLVNSLVVLYRNHDEFSSFGYDYTNANGEYTITAAMSDTFQLKFVSPSIYYRDRYYENQSSIGTATNIPIPHDALLTGYDAVLPDSGHVTGKVVNSEGVGLEGITVEAWHFGNLEYEVESSVETDADGQFSIPLGKPYEYYLRFVPGAEYFPEYYQNKVNREDALAFTLDAGEVVTITATLERKHTISGTVTNIHQEPLADVRLELYVKDFGDWSMIPVETMTDEAGKYVFETLNHGEYRLGYFANDHFPLYYNQQVAFENATIITLAGDGQSVIADAVLDRVGLITGTVSDIYGVPLDDIRLSAYVEEDGAWSGSGGIYRNEQGRYSSAPYRLGTNAYRFRFSHTDFVEEYLYDAPTVEAAQSITLSANMVISNVNVMLRRFGEVEAGFGGEPRTGDYPLTVEFTDHSKDVVVSHSWDFGDGITSTEISPTHTYTQSGVYTVTLTVAGAENRHTKTQNSYITVTGMPVDESTRLLVPYVSTD